MPEILDQAPIYFRPENPKELCAAMTEIVFDSDVRKKIISKGKCRASMFTWDRAATQTAKIYPKSIGIIMFTQEFFERFSRNLKNLGEWR